MFLNQPACDQNPGIDWETYIAGWHSAQFDNESQFGLYLVLNYIWSHPGQFTVACYGSTLQGSSPQPLYDLPALRAQNVCDAFITDPDEITPLAGYYENAAGSTGFQINLFNPHEDECAVCGGN